MSGRVETIEEAVDWIGRVGLALLFPKDDLVLPSLWEAVAGHSELEWAVREDDGTFVEFTPEMSRVWSWKDELPLSGLACVGKHLRGRVSVVSNALVPAMYALTGRAGAPDDFRDGGLSDIERDAAEVLLADGPCTVQDVRDALPQHDGKRVAAAVERLQKRFVATSAGLARRTGGWAPLAFDLVARRHDVTGLPQADEARRVLVLHLLRGAGELSAVDVTAALGWRKADAVAALDATGVQREEADGVVLWRQPRAKSAA